MSQLLATLDLIRDHLNPDLAIKGVVLTMFDARTKLSADVAAEVRRHLGARVFETVIPRNVRLAEAPSHGKPISSYSPEFDGCRRVCAPCQPSCGRETGGSRPPRTDEETMMAGGLVTVRPERSQGLGSRSRLAHPATQPGHSRRRSRWRSRASARTRTSHASGSTRTDWRR